MSAFLLGFCVLVTYPYYFGIEAPVEIILTPIGLVFVLEIDNWMYDIAKQCYKETRMEQVWTFKASLFREKLYTERVSDVANAIGFLYYIGANIALVFTALHMYGSAYSSSSIIGVSAVVLSLIGLLWTFSCCWCCFRKIGGKNDYQWEVAYDDNMDTEE